MGQAYIKHLSVSLLLSSYTTTELVFVQKRQFTLSMAPGFRKFENVIFMFASSAVYSASNSPYYCY
jgi:hypothetical protein